MNLQAAVLAPGTHLRAAPTIASQELTQLPSVAALMDDESRPDDSAARHPQSILCPYDIDERGAGAVFEAMRLHPPDLAVGTGADEPVLRAGRVATR